MSVFAPAPHAVPVNLIPGFHSALGVGGELGMMGGSAASSAAWPSANRAIFIPFYLPVPKLVRRCFYVNGTTGGDGTRRVDIGVYDNGGGSVTVNRLFSTGTTVIATNASEAAYIDNADVMLAQGRYYFAIAMDSVTSTILQVAPQAVISKWMAMATMNSAFVLPATATLATPAATIRVPVAGLSFRASP